MTAPAVPAVPAPTSSSSIEGVLTRNDILEVSRQIAHDRKFSLKHALALVQNRLDLQERHFESDLAYSLLQELTSDPALCKTLERRL